MRIFLLACLMASTAALAQTVPSPAPPYQPGTGGQFTTGPMGFTTGPMDFTTGPMDFTTGPMDFTTPTPLPAQPAPPPVVGPGSVVIQDPWTVPPPAPETN